MGLDIGEPVPYDATAVRPAYADLPATVRAEIAARVGGEPMRVDVAGGGFGGGFAARVTGPKCEFFVKATSPHNPYVLNACQVEARVNPALPEGVPAPRLRFSSEVDDWLVLGFEAAPGRAPRLPLSAADLSLLLDAWARAAERLSPAPDSLRRLPLLPMPTDGFRNFAAAAAGEAPPPELPDPCAGRLEQLAEWEGNLAASIDADEVIHGDLRLDNMVLGADRAWICDWTMPNLGASWFDTAVFLVTAHGDGHPAEALFWSHPTSAGVTDEQLDSVLAAVAGYCLCNSRKPLIDGVSPYVRRHQRWSGLATLDWLARRRGW